MTQLVRAGRDGAPGSTATSESRGDAARTWILCHTSARQRNVISGRIPFTSWSLIRDCRSGADGRAWRPRRKIDGQQVLPASQPAGANEAEVKHLEPLLSGVATLRRQ